MCEYEQARAWGIFRRQSMPSGPDARRAAAAILNGQAPDLPDPAVDWIKSLSAEEIEEIYHRSLAVMDYVVYELGCLIEFPSDQEGWHERCRMVFQQREELEGVAELLQFTSRGADLRDLLGASDEDCSSRMEHLPPVRGIKGDPRLSRAAISTPEAWWLSLV